MTVAVLVLSCDKYSPYWAGWHHFWAKHWQVQGVPVYFATEAKQLPEWPGVSPIYVGKGHTWSTCLLRALAKVKADTVFFSLEDYWPTQDMSQSLWDALYREFLDEDLLCLRCSSPKTACTILEDGRLAGNSRYLVSCQTSFWDKDHLVSCIDPSEDPWQFEIKGTERVRERGLAHRIKFHPLPWYAHTCVRGKLTKEGKCLTNQIT